MHDRFTGGHYLMGLPFISSLESGIDRVDKGHCSCAKTLTSSKVFIGSNDLMLSITRWFCLRRPMDGLHVYYQS
jgi:hypothetical protein